ncbi:pyridoxal phosphate-dependent aminotransferase [Mariniluteicoccus endophyticus]
MNNPLIHRMQGFTTTIFAEMTGLAVQHDAINLGQGFPDSAGPEEVLDAAAEAMARGDNQYAPGIGVPALREAVAHHQRAFYGIELDPDTQVMASAGATEAMTSSILALCEAGDEVVVLEPTYDCYEQAVALAGGVLRRVRLHEPTYALDTDELRAAVNDRTKLLIINTPHNPTGHVLTAAEMQAIADVAVERDLVVLTDEVYEHLTFDGRAHTPLATLPGMFERTVSISSAGKTFSVTGWKIGWLTGPAGLLAAIHTVKQNLTYTNGTPLQHGVAAGLRLPKERFEAIRRQFEDGRDRLVPGLEAAGLCVHPSEGSYFVMTDIRPLGFEDGYEFCRMLPGKIGVAAIPAQVFYADPTTARHLVRFTFAKQHDILDEAARRLATLG